MTYSETFTQWHQAGRDLDRLRVAWETKGRTPQLFQALELARDREKKAWEELIAEIRGRRKTNGMA